jgi:hypothetical protein
VNNRTCPDAPALIRTPFEYRNLLNFKWSLFRTWFAGFAHADPAGHLSIYGNGTGSGSWFRCPPAATLPRCVVVGGLARSLPATSIFSSNDQRSSFSERDYYSI